MSKHEHKDSFSPEVVLRSRDEAEKTQAYLQISHLLSVLNERESLRTTPRLAFIMPKSILANCAYGFDKDGEVFLLHLTSSLFDWFATMGIQNATMEDNGITFSLTASKYGSFLHNQLVLHFEVVNEAVLEKARNCKYFTITKIIEAEDTLENGMPLLEVFDIVNPAIALEEKKNITNIEMPHDSEELRRIF